MLSAAIVGAGIGGLTTALALRAHGIEHTVYEGAPELRPVGAGLVLSPNALMLLGRLGLADELIERGWPLERAEIHDARSGLLQRIDMSETVRRYGLPTVAIHRARLHEVLLTALGTGTLELSRACTSIREENGHTSVVFASGSPVDAGMVIGADGLRSVVRLHVAPGFALRYSGQTSWRGIADLRLGDHLAYDSREFWGAHCRFGFAPVERDRVYWFATRDAPPGVAASAVADMDRLYRVFDRFPYPVGDLLRSTRAETVVRTDITDVEPFRGWSRGRVVLLGDAAHATTPNLGQGAAQAIEDAWVLSEQLGRGGPVEAAFRRYEDARAPKAHYIVRRSRQFGKLAHAANPVLRIVRNAAIRHTPQSVTEREMNRIFVIDY